jgi:glutamyl-tRNA synthetase
MSSTTPPVRVRFCPSPTGFLHIGGVRSALFDWLWARHTGGTYVLRIEDTDRTRFVEGATDQINDSLEALGIAPDEGPRQGGEYGPYTQSERLDIYADHAQQLLGSGALYRCWCSPERLTKLREEAQAKGVAFKYDRHCLAPGNQGRENEPHVLRFRIPDAPDSIGWDDVVRGRLDFKTRDLDDFVAVKADLFPTYHFANVVDDHLMQISHVLRADEWLPSTPKHLLLFAAFGWDPPHYAHLPAVLGPTGTKKLSKRDGAQSVQEYLDEGYLPEALRSFLASLGWNDGTTQEVYGTDELVKQFTLERIQRSPAKFDKERLTWVNGQMIRQMAPATLLERSERFWPATATDTTRDYRLAVLGLVQERLKFLSELPELTEFFFVDPKFTPELLPDKKLTADTARQWLPRIIDTLDDSDFSEADLEQRLRGLVEQLETSPGILFSLIRRVVTGRPVAPGLFETLQVLGAEASLRRLRAAL